MSEKITLIKGENVSITQEVLMYDGKEKQPGITVHYFRPSAWVPDQVVSGILHKDSNWTEGDYVLEGELCGVEPGVYHAVIRGIRKYDGEIPVEWEIFSRDDPRITENPFAEYFLGRKSKRELEHFGFDPLNMDETYTSLLPTYEKVLRYYEERQKQKIPLTGHYSVFSMKSDMHSYQDSYYPLDVNSFEVKEDRVIRFAVADGVTNSYRSKPYADLVTGQFCLSGSAVFLKEELPIIGEEWKSFILRDAEETYPNNPLMLRKEKKLLQHKRASATLAGLELDGKREMTITTVGDSVVFEIAVTEDGPRIMHHTPPLTSDEFTNRPEQIHSDDEACPDEYIKTRRGTFERGSIFLLATDALAQFILTPEEEEGVNKVADLLAIKNNCEFEEYCAGQKAAGKLHDDDYTMIVVRIK